MALSRWLRLLLLPGSGVDRSPRSVVPDGNESVFWLTARTFIAKRMQLDARSFELNMDLPQPTALARAESHNYLDQRGSLATFLRRLFSAFVLLGVSLAFTPLRPTFPDPNLDSAWEYAMNEAVARGMVFGRDVIFTFGPYACAYTWQYHPATDHLMLIADSLFGLALATGALVLVRRSSIGYLLLLPALVVLVSRDFALFSLPLLFLMVSVRVTLPDDHKWKLPEKRQVLLSLALIMLVLSLLTLVKGTHGLMSASLGGLGGLLLLRWRPRWALLLATVFIGGLVGFWLAAGQPLGALPMFFVAQIPIFSGYSDAMSLTGSSPDLICYGISAGLMLFASLLFVGRRTGLSGTTLCLGLALSLFLVFKASFIRHSTGAQDFVLLASFLFAISLPRFWAAMIIASSIAVWLPLRVHHLGDTGTNLIGSIESSQTLGHAWEGLRARLGFGPDLRQQFETARTQIRHDNPLPRVDGSADIYPYRQDILLSSGLGWSPRPIVQSYSTYEPKLASINANHLSGSSAPLHVFFDVSPIDGRLASLEDGKSLPLLLTRYHLVGRSGRFLVLDRYLHAGTDADMEDITTSTQRLGHLFDLPKVGEPIWAEVDLKPTLLGRILGVIYKRPLVHIVFRYADGHSENFRYVAAMGRSGFIIAPVIHDTADLAALLIKRREQYYSGAWPTSVELVGEAGTRLFWKRAFKVRLRRIELPVQLGAENFVYDPFIFQQWITERKAVGSAQCSIDAVNRQPVPLQGIDAKGPLLVQGWAAVSAEQGIPADQVFVTVSSNDGKLMRTARARAVPRPDVNAYFKHPEMPAVGFEALLDTTDLKGRYKLQIFVKWQNQLLSCPTAVEIRY